MKTFKITDEQEIKLDKWKSAIKEVFGEYGLFEYRFTPDGIGEVLEVYSHKAKMSIDLTDIDKY